MKNLTQQRGVALGTLAVLSATLMAGMTGTMVTPAQAGSKTWKKVAIGGAALGTYGLVKHKGKLATIGGLVAAGSYLKYRSDKKKESKTYRRKVTRYRRR